ncbi:branched-chain amino acid ABC transporter permease [Paracoccus sp. (in: a-proteobacteria)]|uniref:branched-chain amino acid ABC transporter permease n=1 Tax=Paracoccus sp. TaxID=267 RepID=UPI00289BE650|nr:branched-chain amino acid ABC transporter permease [Paracoccus sp. (in: a-proteobacteria)]
MSNTRQADTTSGWRAPLLFAVVALLFILEGTTRNAVFSGSWNSALTILNMGLISAVMALGINLQWGYAGLFNAGVVGFVAIGGLAPVLIATKPIDGAWQAGGWGLVAAFATGIVAIYLAVQAWKRLPKPWNLWVMIAVLIAGFMLYRGFFDPAVIAIEANNSASAGNIGGLGLPVLLSWPVGALFAAIAAWGVGKVALGLRSDYLAIATLGIGEIIVAVMRNEEWLARGVKNMSGIPRPVPYEIDLQASATFVERASALGMDPATASGLWVKLLYTGLFTLVLLAIIALAQLALNSPWGRMMRAIRDNETAAEAMGKDVTRRHLQIFVIGSAVIGLAGAMMITQDGLMSPGGYAPLRYTFLIWVMVIVGGSGNNWGAVLGGVLIWFLWIKAEVWGPKLMETLTFLLPDGELRSHLIDSAPHVRFIAMGLVLLLVLRFAPRGLLPEK